MLSFIKESPEGVSSLCTGVIPGSISPEIREQDGLFVIVHESASFCRDDSCTVPERSVDHDQRE